MTQEDVFFGVTGQSLVFDAPEGKPSSVTSVQVFATSVDDDGTAETATTGTASIDAASTTVDAASGAGQANPRILRLTATTSFLVGRSYLAVSAGGAREFVEVVSIATADYVTTRYPMANAYVASDAVYGTRISIALSSTWVANEAKITGGADPGEGYRVRWVYVVDGATYVHDSFFDLVRYAGNHTVTAAAIEAMYPGFAAMLPSYHRQDSGRRLVDEAFQQVKWDLHEINLDDSSVMDQDALDRATLLRLGVLMAKSRLLQGQGDPTTLEMTERDYQTFMTKIFRTGSKVDVDTDGSGAASRVITTPLFVR